MTAVSKSVYFDVVDHVVNNHNNKYHRAIKIKPIDVKKKLQIDFANESNDKDPKFKIGYHVRISK